MSKRITNWAGLILFAAAAGCGSAQDTTVKQTAPNAAPDAAYVLQTEPADAKGVGQLRKESKNDDEITVIGRIGGSESPFVDGLAAFSIVDPALKHCADEEGCPTPWDYCCADKLKDNKAMVKIVDAQGNPVAKDARGLLAVKELSTVVVRGKAKRDPEGNLTVLAEKVFVKK